MITIIKELLKKNIKPTFIRLKILKYLKESKKHPTVDMIYKKFIKEIPTISKTTVYNTLNIFSEKGLAIPIIMPDIDARYDGTTSKHLHFFCEVCGEIIDLSINCEYFKKRCVQKNKIKEFHGYFRGICHKCIEKKEYEKMDAKKYECIVCGYIYNPEKGDPGSGVEKGTSFEDLPDDWLCPVCGVGKDRFKEVE